MLSRYERQRARVEFKQDFIKAYKNNAVCNKCGKSFISDCLDFHHKDPSQKETDINSLIHKQYSIDRLKTEIKKCELICGNCHTSLHRKDQNHYNVSDEEMKSLIKKSYPNSTPRQRIDRYKRFKSRRYVYRYKLKHKCRCGEDNPNCLAFHHIDVENKIAEVSTLAKLGHITKLKAEIEKCEILCINCHRLEHKDD